MEETLYIYCCTVDRTIIFFFYFICHFIIWLIHNYSMLFMHLFFVLFTVILIYFNAWFKRLFYYFIQWIILVANVKSWSWKQNQRRTTALSENQNWQFKPIKASCVWLSIELYSSCHLIADSIGPGQRNWDPVQYNRSRSRPASQWHLHHWSCDRENVCH